MKRLLAVVLAGLLAGEALAQSPEVAHLAIAWDVDADALTYPKVRGRGGDPYAGPIQGPGEVTAANSTTVTGTTGAFVDVVAGDIIIVTDTDGTSDVVVIDTKTDDEEVVVDTAVTWTDKHWRYYKFSSGTADTDGWIDVSHLSGGFAVTVQYDQGDLATGLEVRWEGKSGAVDAKPVIIYPGESDGCGGGTLTSGVCLYATAGEASRTTLVVSGDQGWSAIRVGVGRSGADTSDATTNRERVSISVSGRALR